MATKKAREKFMAAMAPIRTENRIRRRLVIVKFLGLVFLRLGVSNSYVWGLVFLRLGVSDSYVWVLVFFTFRG